VDDKAVVRPESADAAWVADAPDVDGMISVVLPSGAAFPVHSEELDYIVDRSRRYLAENHFANVSDLQDVDRMLIMELICFRWGTWISRQKDYWDDAVDVDQLQQSLKAHSVELRQLKKQLGIDKVARDRAKGEDSVPAYLNNLLARAKEFGVHRDTQFAKAMELFNQLKALITLHQNADEVERAEMHVQVDDVFDWIVNIAIPEYDRLDEHFRQSSQRMWVRNI
jgi:hypothetical protein